MMGDGNCFFRAISQALFGNPSRHKEIRKEVVNEIRGNKENYETYTNNFEEHVYHMHFSDGRESSWATEAATTNIYKCDINVRMHSNGNEIWQKFQCQNSRKILNLDHRNNHFNLLTLAIPQSINGKNPNINNILKDKTEIPVEIVRQERENELCRIRDFNKEEKSPIKLSNTFITQKRKDNLTIAKFITQKHNAKRLEKENSVIKLENRYEILSSIVSNDNTISKLNLNIKKIQMIPIKNAQQKKEGISLLQKILR